MVLHRFLRAMRGHGRWRNSVIIGSIAPRPLIRSAASTPCEARENIRTIYDAVIDVRMSAEHRLEGRIVDSINCIPAQLWEHGMYLPRDAFVPDVCEQFTQAACRLLCVCGDGRRSELAAQQLQSRIFR